MNLRLSRAVGVRVAALAFALACSACSWFSKSPPPEPAVIRAEAPVPDDVQSVSAARAVCPNYQKTFEDSSYPRDAIIRGLDRGRASVRFQVNGSTLTVLTVTSSDPSFGDAAVRIVRKLDCHVDRPTTFEIPLEWRSGR